MTDTPSDDELARYLCPDDPAAGLLIIERHPDKRATWKRMYALEGEIALWQAGLGPRPTDAILCGPKEIRGGKL